MSDVADRIARIVRGVCAAAVREAGAAGIVVLDDWTPEGELAYEWLVAELGEARVWRGASMTANVQGDVEIARLDATRQAHERGALVAHPANRTALLLGGRIPAVDLLPLGDVWASQIEVLARRWSAPADVEALGARVGIAALDNALARWLDAREAADAALASLPPDDARLAVAMFVRGRWFRLRQRLVPKLGARTLGIDLFD